MIVDRVFLDANVLFSAAYRPEAGVARLWNLKNVQLMSSPYAIEEARSNLSEDDQQHRLVLLLESVRVVMGSSLLPPDVKLPEKDRPI